MSDFVRYHLGPVMIDGPEVAAGETVSVTLVCVVGAAEDGTPKLKVRDWTGPTFMAEVVPGAAS